MNLKLQLAILFIASGTGLRAQSINVYKADFSAPISIAGYRLAWNDEFNNNGKPDEKNWKYEHGFIRNEELQWYQDDNAICKNGLLVIEGRREKIVNNRYDPAGNDWRVNRQFAEYSSASIQTKGLHQWKYGLFEIRAKIDTSKGAWPAIWTLGVQGSWPSNGEIDIMEFYRIRDEPTILANVAYGTNHVNVAKWRTETIPLSHFTKKDPEWAKKFHIWKMDWNKDSINIYLDDRLLNSTPVNVTVNADGVNPFLQPHFLLLNLAIGGNGGNPAGSKSPLKYEVDYVRIYQKNFN